MTTFHICSTKDCQCRNIDAIKIFNFFEANGIKFTEDYKAADYIIISTCGQKEMDDVIGQKTLIYYHRKRKKDGKIIVIGCLPSINPNIFDGFKNIYLLSPNELNNIDNLIKNKISFNEIPEPKKYKNFPIDKHAFLQICLRNEYINFKRRLKISSIDFNYLRKFKPSRIVRFIRKYNEVNERSAYSGIYNLRIARGCLGNCSYCAIKHAIGRLKSRPIDEIKKQFKLALKNGRSKFFIFSEDNSAYGMDINTNFIDLIRALLQVEGKYQFFCSSMNPIWFLKYKGDLLDMIQKNPERFKMINIPIESGSNKILKSMKRHYDINEVVEFISRLKQTVPLLEIHSSLIIGFPGETEKDFAETKNIISKGLFSSVWINRYNKRPKTEASTYNNNIKRIVIDKRIQEIVSIQNKFGKALNTLI